MSENSEGGGGIYVLYNYEMIWLHTFFSQK